MCLVHSLIEEEIANGIPSNRIAIGGFSMGAALALHACKELQVPFNETIHSFIRLFPVSSV